MKKDGNQSRKVYQTKDILMIVALFLVIALLLYTNYRVTANMGKCNKCLQLWYDYEKDINDTGNYMSFEYVCKIYNQLPG